MFRFTFILFFFAIGHAFSDGSTGVVDQNKNVFVLENDSLRITMINPADDYGCRFNKGGWIKNIVLKDKNEQLLIGDSIFPNHPAFGLTEEYTPSVHLEEKQKDKSVRFKLGVGRVIRSGKSKFKDKPLQFFPWETKVNGPESLTFAQNAVSSKGYDYKLKKKFHLLGSTLHISNHLTNTGNETLSGNLYLHPFFNLKNDLNAGWFNIAGRKNRESVRVTAALKGSDGLFTENTKGKAVHWVATGNHETKSVTGMLCDVDFIKVDVWKFKECYAVEPFIKINVKPGETLSWNWRLLFGRGLSKVSDMNAHGMTEIKRTDTGIDVILLPSKKINHVTMRLRVLRRSGETVYEKVQKCGSAFPFKPVRMSFPSALKQKNGHKIQLDIISMGKTLIHIEEI